MIQDETGLRDVELRKIDTSSLVSTACRLLSQLKHEEAISYLNEAILETKGTCLHFLDRDQEAIACFDEALKIGSNLRRFDLKALCLYRVKRYEEALIFYDKAIEFNPGDAKLSYFKGNIFRDMRKYEEAIRCYDNAMEFSPVLALRQKADCLNGLHRSEEAITCANQVIEIKPRDSLAYCMKGISLSNLKREEEALQYFDRAIEIHQTTGRHMSRKVGSSTTSIGTRRQENV
jgi:tetratricopeptide (TPR) repeat protein